MQIQHWSDTACTVRIFCHSVFSAVQQEKKRKELETAKLVERLDKERLEAERKAEEAARKAEEAKRKADEAVLQAAKDYAAAQKEAEALANLIQECLA